MVGKKGFMRIVEATVSIMIILAALLIMNNNQVTVIGDDLTDTLPPLLEEIARDNVLRLKVIQYDVDAGIEDPNNLMILEDLQTFLDLRIKSSALNYDVAICKMDEICALASFPTDAKGNLFVAERVISTDIREPTFQPRKIKIFLWRKG